LLEGRESQISNFLGIHLVDLGTELCDKQFLLSGCDFNVSVECGLIFMTCQMRSLLEATYLNIETRVVRIDTAKSLLKIPLMTSFAASFPVIVSPSSVSRILAPAFCKSFKHSGRMSL
jgi:hypothetical protein